MSSFIFLANNTNVILGAIFGGITVFTIILVILITRMQKKDKDREEQIWNLADKRGWKSVMNYKYAGLADGFDDFLRLNIPLMKEANFQVIVKNLVEIEN